MLYLLFMFYQISLSTKFQLKLTIFLFFEPNLRKNCIVKVNRAIEFYIFELVKASYHSLN